VPLVNTLIMMALISAAELVILIGIGIWLAWAIERISTQSTPVKELGYSGIGVIGAVGTGVLAILWNFFLPLNQLFAVTVMLVGIGGLVRSVIYWKRGGGNVETLVAPDVLIALTIIVLASSAANDNYLTHYDSGLYHIPTIVLDSNGPILIGAANIHMRFGYNSSLYPLSAAFFYPYFGVAASALVNVPLTALIGGAMVGSFRRSTLSRRDLPALGVALFLGFHMLNHSSLLSGVGAPQTDWPSFLLTSYVILLCVQILVHLIDPPSDEYISSRIWMACLVAAFAVTIKLTQVLVPCVPIVTIVMLVSTKRMKSWAPTLLGLVLTGIVFTVWCARGVLLSGCLAYPIFTTCVTSLPWTVAHGTAADDLAWMASFAKVPGGASPQQVPPFLDWLGPWSASLLTDSCIKQAAMLVALAMSGILIRLVFGSRVTTLFEHLDRTQQVGVLGIGGVLLGSVAVWFLTAPLPRYAEASMYNLASVIAAFSIPIPRGQNAVVDRSVLGGLGRARLISPLMLALLIGYLLFADIGVLKKSLDPTLWPRIPDAQVEAVVSPLGLKYYKPFGQNSMQCWAALEPCTYFPDPAAREAHALIWTVIERASISHSASNVTSTVPHERAR
jgi:hypothetical protein